MGNNNIKPPKKLYHYTNPSEKTLDNLENQMIYLSRPFDFNDIFDCRVYKFSKLSITELGELYDSLMKDTLFQAKFPKPGFTQLNDTFNNQISERRLKIKIKRTLDDISKQRGVFCMSKVVNNLLMWGHYAESYSGICLEFETSMDPFQKAKKVSYSDELPEVSKLKMVMNGQDESMKIFLTKSKCWEYEDEWRLFHHSYGKVKYKTESLIGIYFGPKIKDQVLDRVINLVKKKNPKVNCYIGKISDSKYEINFYCID